MSLHVIHSRFTDSGQPVEIVRGIDGRDGIRALGKVWCVRDADQLGRLLIGMAAHAAAHNAGALGQVRP